MQVFISYAREDRSSAQKLFLSLKQIPDVEPWWDIDKLLPGTRWQDAIMKAIEESNFIILLLSKNSINKKGFVQREIEESLNQYSRYPPGRIFLIPARLEECFPKHQKLQELQWVDLFPHWDVGIEQISQSIEYERTYITERAIDVYPKLAKYVAIEDEFQREITLSPTEILDRLRTHSNLVGMNMINLDLRNIDFSGADLRGANLVGTNLTGSKFVRTNFKGANLERAILIETDFTGANLWGVNLWRATMWGVRNLSKAESLQHTNFYHVDGLTDKDEEVLKMHKIVILGDYGSFFDFFSRTLKMKKREIESVFIWIRHSYFRDLLRDEDERAAE